MVMVLLDIHSFLEIIS